jgi:hypothetical protein
MSEWMSYVYQQRPRPTNVTGVEVVLSVLDSNNNFREIGKTTTDENGFYSLQYNPDIPGKFNVYANFAGNKAYWPSRAEAAFAVDAVEPAAPPPETPPDMTGTYITYATIAIIAALAVGVAIIVLILRRR